MLAPTLDAIGEGFPSRGGGYFPDADHEEAFFVMKEIVKMGIAKKAEIIFNDNVPTYHHKRNACATYYPFAA